MDLGYDTVPKDVIGYCLRKKEVTEKHLSVIQVMSEGN